MEEKKISDIEDKKQTTINQQVNVDIKTEKSEKEIDLAINMNKWGFAFIFLFAGLLAYIFLSGFIGIFPFERPDPLANEVNLKSSLGLTLMLVTDLIFLGLGIYFGWIRSTPETDTSTEKVKAEIKQEVVFTETEEETTEDEIIKEEEE